MELMQSDVFVKSAARRLFALLTAVVAFAIPRHVPIALRTLDALLIRPQPVEPAQCRGLAKFSVVSSWLSSQILARR